ncbi:MAG: hypothetical protein ABEJ25_00480 [Candidatus Bipolaricaulia bacterium]
MAYNSNYKKVDLKEDQESQIRTWVYNSEAELPKGVGPVRQKIEGRVDGEEKFDLEKRQALMEKAVNAIADYLINGTSLKENLGFQEYAEAQAVIQGAYEEEGFDHQVSLIQKLMA